MYLYFVDSLDVSTRSQAAAVFGTICQNNIKVQLNVYEKGYLDRLSNLFLAVDLHKLRAKVRNFGSNDSC